jgi:membrane protein YqaA with SNARE-associated domain
VKWILIRIFFVLAGFISGAILGGITLMNFFGNYLTHVQMFGVRGYEVGFKIGAVTGGIVGVMIGYFLPLLFIRHKGVQKKDG